MDKYFWRGLLAKAGAHVPRELARWKQVHLARLRKFDAGAKRLRAVSNMLIVSRGMQRFASGV